MRLLVAEVTFFMQSHTEAHKIPYSLRVTSPAFRANGPIPAEHTGDGPDVAPKLSWGTPPPGTKSVVVLVEDLDAPRPMARTWVHWIVSGIPPLHTTLDGDELPPGAVVGTNDWGQRKWMGPNPEEGRHRYFFKVFALDIVLARPNMRRPELFTAMKGHILAQGELIGTYEKAH